MFCLKCDFTISFCLDSFPHHVFDVEQLRCCSLTMFIFIFVLQTVQPHYMHFIFASYKPHCMHFIFASYIATSFQLSMELMSIFIASCVCALVPIFHLLHSFATFIKISFSSFFCVFVKFFQWYDHVLWKRILCLWICYSSQFVHLCFFASFLKYLVHHLPLSLSFIFSNHFYKKKVMFQHIG